MATLSQLTANQLNAQLSTGPRTPEGKAVVSQNALKHGLASAFSVLPNENQDEFDGLAKRFREEFQPDGEHESFLVEQLVQSRWKLSRIQRIETAMLDQMIRTGPDEETGDGRIAASLLGAAGKALANLQRYAAAAERTYHKSYRELVRGRKEAQKAQEKYAEATLSGYLNAPMPSARPLPTPSAKPASGDLALRL